MIRFESIRPQLLLDNGGDDSSTLSDDESSGNGYHIKGKDIEDKIETVIADLLKLSRNLNHERSENFQQNEIENDTNSENSKSATWKP